MRDPFNLSRALFMITDPDDRRDVMLEHIHAAIRGGASHILLRRPKAASGELYNLSTTISPRFREGATWSVVVHERVDVAIAAFAQGAHLTPGSIPGGPAKGLLGSDRLLGVSVHKTGQAVSAMLQQADYVMFGHVYESESHPGQPGRGLDALREVVQAISLPVIAVGGITAERVDDVLAAGASGVAVIRAISRAADPEAATRELRSALDRAPYPHLS